MKKITSLFIVLLCFVTFCFAQDVPKDWLQKDPATGEWGMNVEGAYKFLQGKKSTTVIVAVIDAGVEVDHPDLITNIWVNPKEIAGNGVDDDHNGYVDDIHGWDFIGGKNGDVQYDQYEETRLYKMYSIRFKDKDATTISAADKDDFEKFQKLKKQFETDKADADRQYATYSQYYDAIKGVIKAIGKDDITADDLKNYNPEDKLLFTGKIILQSIISKGGSVKETVDELKSAVDYFESKSKYGLNPDYDSRTIVGDNYTDATEHYYGNNDVTGPDAMHGTHVAGMIGAIRNNGIGIDGIADNVKIMVIRAVPDGDERDKDIANAIRYAVDNGAKVINMSFGKDYVFNKKVVDDAVEYAQSKDVLLVHGSGNDNKNVDNNVVYPNDQLLDGKKVNNFLNVGATDINGDAASFSNYGKKNVDVFAPGVKIYSTVTNHGYKYLDGTSMACPAAAGVAVLIREYYPNLTAAQVKAILIKSCMKTGKKTMIPGSSKKKVKLKKLCVSGGIVNALNAVELADKMTK
jgi:cell wall-associated protease